MADLPAVLDTLAEFVGAVALQEENEQRIAVAADGADLAVLVPADAPEDRFLGSDHGPAARLLLQVVAGLDLGLLHGAGELRVFRAPFVDCAAVYIRFEAGDGDIPRQSECGQKRAFFRVSDCVGFPHGGSAHDTDLTGWA